jgi:hypothetical protein
MYTAFPNVTSTEAGKTRTIEMRLEHDTGRESVFRLVRIEKKGKRYQDVSSPLTIPLSLLENVTLRGRSKARAGGVTIEAHGSKQDSFTSGGISYRGSMHIKVTVGSGGKRVELVMTRHYLTGCATTIKNLRNHPERYI